MIPLGTQRAGPYSPISQRSRNGLRQDLVVSLVTIVECEKPFDFNMIVENRFEARCVMIFGDLPAPELSAWHRRL
jgi:hypothetical protein